MPIGTIRLTKQLTDDIASVCKLTPAQLVQFADLLETRRSAVIEPTKLRDLFSSQIDKDSAKVLTRILISMAALCRDAYATATEFLDELTDELSRGLSQSKFTEPSSQTWAQCRPALERLLKSQPVMLTAKAADLTYDYSHIYVAGRILTDIRPIFDDPRQVIVGAIVTQTLRLEYHTAQGEHSNISVAMDDEDVERLRKACVGALQKSSVAKQLSEKKCGIETITAGTGIHDLS